MWCGSLEPAMNHHIGGKQLLRAIGRAFAAGGLPKPWGVLALALALVAAGPLASALAEAPTLPARALSAPPEDITSGLLGVPQPLAWESSHALLPFDHGVLGGDVQVGVGRPGILSMVPIVPPGWSIRVAAPDGAVLIEGGAIRQVSSPFAGAVHRVDGDIARLVGTDDAAVTRFDIEVRRNGVWTVTATPPARGGGLPAGAGWPPMLLVRDGDATLSLRATVRSLRVAVGEPTSIDVDLPPAMARGTLEAEVVDPHGTAVPVFLEGLDAQRTATFVPQVEGVHTVSLRANTGRPLTWRRSVELIVDAVGIAPRLVGQATVLPVEGSQAGPGMSIRVALDRAAPDGVFVAAEVWHVGNGSDTPGTAATIAATPISWIAGLSVARDDAGPAAILTFDRRWLGRAGVSGGTLELRNVRIHDRRTWGLLDQIDAVPLGPSPAPLAAPEHLTDLLLGPPGGRAVPTTSTMPASAEDAAPVGSHALLIVHGYCSDGVTFPPNQFTGPVGVFLDPNQAKGNDAFAQTLLAYGSQFRSYGVVGHSQGGNASLHLYTFYWSGFDWAQPNASGGNRLIQSVGSPYQGTPLAGNLAILGQIFGAGCGTIADLTPSGATTWLSTIPTWARQKVWYWTTSFLNVPFQYDYCDLVTDLFLSDPDDGVVEKTKGQLPGANNMGHTEGWCHIEDMRDPPQCTDATRNAQMNGAAAR